MHLFVSEICHKKQKNEFVTWFFVFILGGPDGGLQTCCQAPLILPLQTSVKEALLLSQIHFEGKSSALPDD